MLCTYLSAVLLGGPVLNATLGWGWADPVAGLVIAAVALKQGRDAWRGKGCCGPADPAHHDDEDDAPSCGDSCGASGRC